MQTFNFLWQVLTLTWTQTKAITARASFITPTKWKMTKKTSDRYMKKINTVLSLQCRVCKTTFYHNGWKTQRRKQYDLHVWRKFFLEVGEAWKHWRHTCRRVKYLDMLLSDGDEEKWCSVWDNNSTIVSKKPPVIPKWHELQNKHSQRMRVCQVREVILFKKETAGFWRSERKSTSYSKRSIQCWRKFVVSQRWIWWRKPWRTLTYSLVVIGTSLWIRCLRREQKTQMRRHCSSNRQRNWQWSSDLEIREKIQDVPWQ